MSPSRTHTVRAGALGSLLLASFVVVLDFAGSIILLPSIESDLGGTLSQLTWVVAAFVLTFAVGFVPAARSGARHGRRRLLVAGLGVFVIASAVAATTPWLTLLLAARVGQGAGAAMIEPAVFAIVKTDVSAQRREVAFNARSGVFLLGAALGPILPAALATWLSWRYVFWLDVIVALASLVGVLRLVPSSSDARSARGHDIVGLVLGAAGLVAVFSAVIDSGRLGWTSPPVIGGLVGAAVLLVLFLFWEARTPDPLLTGGLCGHRLFTIGNIIRALTEFTSLGIFLPLSGFLQTRLDHSPLIAGLLLMPVIGGALVTGSVAEKLAARLDLRLLTVPGFTLVAIGIFWVAHVSQMTNWEFFIAPLAVAGAGIGLLENPAETAIQTGTPATVPDTAWRTSYVIYLLGIGIGVAVVSSVWQTSSHLGAAAAVNTALYSCVAAALAGVITAMFLTRPLQSSHS